MDPATQQAFNQGAARANAAYQGARRRFTVDPIPRLEGHGKIDIFLDDKGDVERAYLQVPELRGFGIFAVLSSLTFLFGFRFYTRHHGKFIDEL